VAAVVVIFGWSIPELSVVDWLAPLSLSQRIEVLFGLVVLILLLAGGWLLVQVMSQQGRLLPCVAWASRFS
jgi:flagellar biogenesis protein FliO